MKRRLMSKEGTYSNIYRVVTPELYLFQCLEIVPLKKFTDVGKFFVLTILLLYKYILKQEWEIFVNDFMNSLYTSTDIK